MRYVFVFNPAAGKGKSIKYLLPQIKRYLTLHRLPHDIFVTERKGDAKAFARSQAMQGGPLRIYACGGEGTTHEIVNGIVGYPNAEFGQIPCGTANDFIRSFGDAKDFMCIDDQVHGCGIPIDLIRCGERYAFNCCSVGMDAMVADNMQRFKRLPFLTGGASYMISIGYTFFKKFGLKLDVTIDGEEYPNLQCLFAVCANAKYYGGGFCPAPNASPNDGALDYSILQTKSRLKVISMLPKYRKGTHLTLAACKHGLCECMQIKTDQPIAINCDGEIEHGTYAKFELVKHAARFIMPKVAAQKFSDRQKAEDRRYGRVSLQAEQKPGV